MAITDWPKAERPREKLLERGPQALSDAELLAIFLRTGVAGKTAVDVARELLARFGGLRNLLAADRPALCAAPGLGAAKYAQLVAALEIGRRHLGEALARGAALESTADTRRYLQARLRDLPHEVFCCLFLDNRHRVLAHNAAAVILAHNHPSGVAEPSRADETLTERLKEALTLVDVRLLDHLVVGDGEMVSFSERGLV